MGLIWRAFGHVRHHLNTIPPLPTALGEARRDRLRGVRSLGIFEPKRAGDGPRALETLGQALPYLDAVQVRIKPAERRSGPSEARELFEVSRSVVALAADLPADRRPLVFVNDRPDVARAVEGVDGVHVGQDDAPAELTRAFIGPDLLLGLSTHDLRQVAEAQAEPVDYLGFGPVFPSLTKGYERGLGSERALCAARASSLPLFPIGGIDLVSVLELAELGRAAVSSAVFEADNPAAAARELAGLLEEDEAL